MNYTNLGRSGLKVSRIAVAALDVSLSADEIARLEADYRPHPILGHV